MGRRLTRTLYARRSGKDSESHEGREETGEQSSHLQRRPRGRRAVTRRWRCSFRAVCCTFAMFSPCSGSRGRNLSNILKRLRLVFGSPCRALWHGASLCLRPPVFALQSPTHFLRSGSSPLRCSIEFPWHGVAPGPTKRHSECPT